MADWEVSDILTFDTDISREELLFLAASAESKSEHPLGKAIVEYARGKGIMLSEAKSFKMTAEEGSVRKSRDAGCTWEVKNFLPSTGFFADGAVQSALERFRMQGKASVLISDEERCIGVLALF